MRETRLEWLPGIWQFTEEEPDNADAVAWIARPGSASWLAPARAGVAAESFGLFRTTFPAEVDNSGFVGWLASRIKKATGSGLVVVCGYSAADGGVYDYWGVPVLVASGVHDLLEALQKPPSSADLDGAVMRVVQTAATGQIGPETVFVFEQQGSLVSARYGGGAVVDGWIVGTIENGSGAFQYLQVGEDGIARSGQSTLELRSNPDGRRELVETFTWSDGRTGVNRMMEL